MNAPFAHPQRPRRLVRSITLAVATVGLLLPPTRTGAQNGESQARSIMSGVFNEEQANRGRTAHETLCTSCHGAEAYTGADFETAWNGRTAFEFFDLLRQTMPDDNPGGLSREEYVDIITYIFSLNGFPAGANALAYEDDALKAVKIDAPPPNKP